MSLLAKTFLMNLRATYPSELDRDELRITQNGLLMATMEMTKSASGIISPEILAKAEISQGRKLEIPVMKKGTVTISNVRTCSFLGGESESDIIDVTWKTIVANITMFPSEYEKNEVSKLFDFNKKVRELVEAFTIEIESDIDATFDAEKTTVYGSQIVGVDYTLTGNAIQVPVAQQQFFFNDLDAINFADDFNNPKMRIVASHSVMPVVSRFINQGGSNAENSAFQFAGKNFTFSNRITVGAGIKGTGYFMPDGSIGLLTREDVDARMIAKSTGGMSWFVDNLPGLPFPVGIKYYSGCADKSEENGLEHLGATLVENWQISVDYGILTAYNSDTDRPSAIRKFEFVP